MRRMSVSGVSVYAGAPTSATSHEDTSMAVCTFAVLGWFVMLTCADPLAMGSKILEI